MKVKLTIWIIFIIFIIIFILGNTESMDIVFIKRFQAPKIVVILVSLAIGFIGGLLMGGRRKKEKTQREKISS
ncbi:MAG: LapA family protein [candidate division WOR-3 bacterium]